MRSGKVFFAKTMTICGVNYGHDVLSYLGFEMDLGEIVNPKETGPIGKYTGSRFKLGEDIQIVRDEQCDLYFVHLLRLTFLGPVLAGLAAHLRVVSDELRKQSNA